MKPTQTQNTGADVLRGIAILIVVAFHSFGPVYGEFLPWDGLVRNFAKPPSQQLLWFYPITFGWAGVAIFFVLSGFCIHLSFLRNRNFGIALFFWRRLWRIYPAYFISLLVFTIFTHTNIFSSSGAQQFWLHTLFLQNIHQDTFFGINPSFWSIAVEVQLYLLFPILLSLRSHFGMVRCLHISLAIGLISRIVVVALWGIPDHLIAPALTSPFITWFDWILGAFVAEQFFEGRPAFKNRQIWLSVLIPLLMITTLFKPFTIFSFSIAAAIAAVILDATIYVRWQKSLWLQPLVFIATISYSIYLWHQPLLFPITQYISHLIGSPVVAWLLLVPLIIGGSWTSFRYVEQIGVKIGSSVWKYLYRLWQDH
jgi:peptidoglycan/LPS O-acetylase OafA/YrhL